MKILLLTPQRPYPPHQGTTLRNFNLIKQLAGQHELHLITFLEPDQTPHDPGPLPQFCQSITTIPMPIRTMRTRLRQLLLTARPDMSWRLWSPEFVKRLTQYLSQNQVDLVQIEGIEMAPYLAIMEQASPKPKIIYDAHNAEWILQKRACLADVRTPRRWIAALYSWVQWQRLRRYEADLLRRVDHTIAMSPPDEAALREVCPDATMTVVPNGVDVAAYTHYQGQPIPYDLLFTGKMDFRPNIDAVLWFGQHVWPLIQAKRPETTFAIVGQRPHPRLDGLRELSGLTITGFVESVQPYLAGAKVYVAPLRVGGGTRLKLMEAMAMGVPIVSTTVGAEGFPVTHAQELLLADTPIAFAEAVLELLQNPTRRAKVGQSGQQFAQENYDWKTLVPRLAQVYEG